MGLGSQLEIDIFLLPIDNLLKKQEERNYSDQVFLLNTNTVKSFELDFWNRKFDLDH